MGIIGLWNLEMPDHSSALSQWCLAGGIAQIEYYQKLTHQPQKHTRKAQSQNAAIVEKQEWRTMRITQDQSILYGYADHTIEKGIYF
jgi:hypothetical protein